MRLLLLLGLFVVAAVTWEQWISWHHRDNALQEELILYGNVDVREVDLAFRVQGRLATLPFQEGDVVPEGALIATLDPQPYQDQVLEAKAEIQVQKAMLENAALLAKRRQELMSDGSVSKEDYENAASKKDVQEASLQKAQAALGVATTNLNDTRLYAPVEGFLLTRIREPGSIVRVGDPICTLSIRSPVWVRAYVNEPQLGRIRFGMPASVHTDTPGGKVFKGQIGFISPVAAFTPKTVETADLRTSLVYPIRVITEDPENQLRQGMPVTVHLNVAHLEETASDPSKEAPQKASRDAELQGFSS